MFYQHCNGCFEFHNVSVLNVWHLAQTKEISQIQPTCTVPEATPLEEPQNLQGKEGGNENARTWNLALGAIFFSCCKKRKLGEIVHVQNDAGSLDSFEDLLQTSQPFQNVIFVERR